jgi:hypothetical protein
VEQIYFIFLTLYIIMPKRHKKGGGFLDTLSNWGNSVSQSASSLWNKTKNTYSSTPSYTPSYTSSTSTYMGGKSRRRHRRGKRGGSFKDNISLTNLAAHAGLYKGGRSRRRRRY